MALLADLPKLVGFFSYSRDDDDSHGALSALRDRIQRELRGQLGRSKETFKLWQDTEMIAAGTQWQLEIKDAVAQSVFFIPIITPTVVKSRYCQFELEAFLEREAGLGRSDLVFPILYIRVPGLEEEARQKSDPVLSIIAKRQHLDWREFRHRDVNSPDVREKIERFCENICDALHRSWVSPEERKEMEEVAARERAVTERARQEAEAKRREGEERKRAEALALARVEEEQRQRTAEAERQRAEADRLRAKLDAELRAADQRLKAEAEAKRRAEEQGLRAEAEAKRAEEKRLRDEEDAKRQAEAQQRRAEWWGKTRERVQKPKFLVAVLLVGVTAAIGIGLLINGDSSSPSSKMNPTPSNEINPTPFNQACSQAGTIRYDGMYQNPPYYLRFYSDGTVVFVSRLTAPPEKEINKSNYSAKGTFAIADTTIKFTMNATLGQWTVDFQGAISDKSICMSQLDRRTGKKTDAVYTFASW